MTVLLGNGAGSFTSVSGSPFAVSTVTAIPGALAVGDFNGDGKTDVAVAGRVSGNASVLLGTDRPLTITAPCSEGTAGQPYLASPVTVSGGIGTYQLLVLSPSWLTLQRSSGSASSFTTALTGVAPLSGNVFDELTRRRHRNKRGARSLGFGYR